MPHHCTAPDINSWRSYVWAPRTQQPAHHKRCDQRRGHRSHSPTPYPTVEGLGPQEAVICCRTYGTALGHPTQPSGKEIGKTNSVRKQKKGKLEMRCGQTCREVAVNVKLAPVDGVGVRSQRDACSRRRSRRSRSRKTYAAIDHIRQAARVLAANHELSDLQIQLFSSWTSATAAQ